MSQFDARGDFYQRIHSGFSADGGANPFVTLKIDMRATIALTELSKCAMPEIATADIGGGLVQVTLTDQQPGGGSLIYYTTDGTFPGYGNTIPGNPIPSGQPFGGGTAQVYAAPFNVPSGATVLFAAYIAGFTGSNVDGGVVN